MIEDILKHNESELLFEVVETYANNYTESNLDPNVRKELIEQRVRLLKEKFGDIFLDYPLFLMPYLLEISKWLGVKKVKESYAPAGFCNWRDDVKGFEIGLPVELDWKRKAITFSHELGHIVCGMQNKTSRHTSGKFNDNNPPHRFKVQEEFPMHSNPVYLFHYYTEGPITLVLEQEANYFASLLLNTTITDLRNPSPRFLKQEDLIKRFKERVLYYFAFI